MKLDQEEISKAIVDLLEITRIVGIKNHLTVMKTNQVILNLIIEITKVAEILVAIKIETSKNLITKVSQDHLKLEVMVINLMLVKQRVLIRNTNQDQIIRVVTKDLKKKEVTHKVVTDLAQVNLDQVLKRRTIINNNTF